jgi:hypothetical protein
MTLHKMHHRDGPETEVAAAQKILPEQSTLQGIVFAALHDSGLKGLTDPELHRRCSKAHGKNRAYSTWRSRRVELVQKGLVVWTGNTIGGHRVWALAGYYPERAKAEPKMSKGELERQYKRTNAWLERIIHAADYADTGKLYAEIEAVEKEMGR